MNAITQSCKIAIFTKYYGPTDFKGSRIKAYTGNGHKLWTSFYAGGANDDAHDYATVQLCRELNWRGDLVKAHTNEGAVYLFSPIDAA